MKKLIYVALFLGVIVATGCQRNVYAGNGKGSKCGCPSTKGY